MDFFSLKILSTYSADQALQLSIKCEIFFVKHAGNSNASMNLKRANQLSKSIYINIDLSHNIIENVQKEAKKWPDYLP